VPLTDVTVPLFVAATVIAPAPLVIDIPVPAVRVALVNVLPVVLPMRSCPFVYVVCPVPPFATARVPVIPVERGNPVQLVNIPDEGVPSAGVTSAGLVDNTTAPDPVDVVPPVPPFATGNVPLTCVVNPILP
jgi:hypothetical protein